MERYLKSVTKECHEIILNQMNNCIYIIKGKDGKNEIGLFCNIKYKNQKIPVLLINNYINNEDYQDKINISFNNKDKIIELENIIYKNKENNISIIKIKEKYNYIKYIEIDDKLYENESEMYYNNESIYIIQYNNIKDILISYGIIKEINNNKLIYNGNIN